MLVAPPPGRKYRDTVTRQLVPADGYEVDPTDLDISRALACGDLVEVTAGAGASEASDPSDPAASAPKKALVAAPKE